MTEPRHLTKPPIKEAIFDFRVRLDPNFDVTAFSGLRDKLINRFPVMEPRMKGSVTIHLQPNPSVEPQDMSLQGFFYRSPAENIIVQFRENGFTINKLEPYTSFEELLPTVLELWTDYAAIAQPEKVSRLALRFINVFSIPGQRIDFDDYFSAAPQVPTGLPQVLVGYNSSITMISDDSRIGAKVTQVYVEHSEDTGARFIFDIDAFGVGPVPVENEAISECLRELREFKNMIFFSFLTDKTLEKFE